MRIFHTADIARAGYFDRQARPLIVYYTGQVAPAGSTVRASYTTPYPYAAFIESSLLNTYKGVAAAPASLVQWSLLFNPYFGGSYVISRINTDSNVIFATFSQQANNFGYMGYSDGFQLLSFDSSVGGQQAYLGSIKGTEFIF